MRVKLSRRLALHPGKINIEFSGADGMMNKKLIAAMAAGGLLFSGHALAAEDGDLDVGVDASSTGSLEVLLQIPDMIRISNLNDVELLYNETTEDFEGSDELCVFRNITGEYGVTATSANGNGEFLLADAGTSTVPYSVTWAGTAVTEGDLLTGQNDADTTQPDCGGAPNITVDLVATGEDVASADSTDDHTDTLTLMVEAE